MQVYSLLNLVGPLSSSKLLYFLLFNMDTINRDHIFLDGLYVEVLGLRSFLQKGGV